MRCPKCHYLSFEPEPRCKNCGYGLDEPDLLMREPDVPDDEPLVDIPFRSSSSTGSHLGGGSAVAVLAPPSEPILARVPPAASAPAASQAVSVSRAIEAPRVETPKAESPKLAPPTTELPLFVKALSASEPREEQTVVQAPAEPRAPLAVRRTVAEQPAPRPQAPAADARKLGPLDRDLLEDLQRIERLERREPEGNAASGASRHADRAGAGKRLGAATLDALLMGGLSAGVLWVTLRWCDLPLERVTVLPAAPTLAFLALVGLGYLLMFTAAGGQTIGKMVMGLRVVAEPDASSAPQALTLKQAFYREILALPSVLALGAGFLPALVGDERALHDRLTHTRVVRV